MDIIYYLYSEHNSGLHKMERGAVPTFTIHSIQAIGQPQSMQGVYLLRCYL